MQKDITSQESETKNQPMTPLQELNTSNSAENNQQVLQQLGEVKELLIKFVTDKYAFLHHLSLFSVGCKKV